MEQANQEICIMKVIFPVKSDEQAIDCKKKIKSALADIPEAQIDFRLMSPKMLMPPSPNVPTG